VVEKREVKAEPRADLRRRELKGSGALPKAKRGIISKYKKQPQGKETRGRRQSDPVPENTQKKIK